MIELAIMVVAAAIAAVVTVVVRRRKRRSIALWQWQVAHSMFGGED